MKKILAIGLWLLGSFSAANAAFVGAFAPGNWTLSPSQGTINLFDENQLSLTSGNVGFEDFTDAYIVLPLSGRVSFDWTYTTEDDPYFELFGVTIVSTDLLFTLVSDRSGGQVQSGSFSLYVTAGDLFAFTAWTLDGNNRAATTVVRNFSFEGAPASVPEPGTLALLAAALAAGAATRHRHA